MPLFAEVKNAYYSSFFQYQRPNAYLKNRFWQHRAPQPKRLQIAFYLLNSWTNKNFGRGRRYRSSPRDILLPRRVILFWRYRLSNFKLFFLKGIFVIYGPEKKKVKSRLIRWKSRFLFTRTFLSTFVLGTVPQHLKRDFKPLIRS